MQQFLLWPDLVFMLEATPACSCVFNMKGIPEVPTKHCEGCALCWIEILLGLLITCPHGLCPHQPQRQCLGPPWAWFGTAAMGGGFPLLASFSATAYNKLESHRSSPSRCFSLCTVIEKHGIQGFRGATIRITACCLQLISNHSSWLRPQGSCGKERAQKLLIIPEYTLEKQSCYTIRLIQIPIC